MDQASRRSARAVAQAGSRLLPVGLFAGTPSLVTPATMPRTCLDTTDAIEAAEILQLITDGSPPTPPTAVTTHQQMIVILAPGAAGGRADLGDGLAGGRTGARHNDCMSRPRSHHPARLSGACPCGLAATYDDCCGRLHRGQARAATPEQLMRSRFSAYAVHDEPYLLRTWHPATRPAAIGFNPAVRWLGLRSPRLHRPGPVRRRGHRRVPRPLHRRQRAGRAPRAKPLLAPPQRVDLRRWHVSRRGNSPPAPARRGLPGSRTAPLPPGPPAR